MVFCFFGIYLLFQCWMLIFNTDKVSNKEVSACSGSFFPVSSLWCHRERERALRYRSHPPAVCIGQPIRRELKSWGASTRPCGKNEDYFELLIMQSYSSRLPECKIQSWKWAGEVPFSQERERVKAWMDSWATNWAQTLVRFTLRG